MSQAVAYLASKRAEAIAGLHKLRRGHRPRAAETAQLQRLTAKLLRAEIAATRKPAPPRHAAPTGPDLFTLI